MEKYIDIIGFEGLYQISNFGNVKSIKFTKSKILKFGINNRGYSQVSLSKNGVSKTKAIHKLVAVAFLEHVPCGHKLVINHKDFNKLNNNVNNLEIVTQRDNANLRHKKSTSSFTGVSWNTIVGKWVSQIYVKKERKFLGYFEDELEASNAYQKALKLTLTEY